ncbi:S-adenosylmethionine:tRNA ribosyltransferase-isomerase, partial [Acinetobacter baumannii]|nr:S-adenosylmethionine:tRNA ribosyltransferase-isomerase [Acinetobacter baumannii]
DKINTVKKNGGQVIAVGTTVTRTLETAYLHCKNGQLSEFSGDTQIFIYPPYHFGVVDRLYLLNVLKRISLSSNPASGLVRLQLSREDGL